MKALNTLLEISLYSTVLFCAIMLLKSFFKNRMSAFLHLALWAIFLARLLLPLTFESSFHFFVLPVRTEEIMTQYAPSPAPDTQPRLNNPPALVPETRQAKRPELAKISPANQVIQAKPPAQVKKQAGLFKGNILLIIWLAGMASGFIYLGTLFFILKRRIRAQAQPPSSRLLELFAEVKQELNIQQKVHIIGQYEYGTPALLFPNTVLMPLSALLSFNDAAIKHILRHELMHFKRKDHFLGLLLSVLQLVYWFNPIVWLACRQIRLDMEIACDAAVVRSFDQAEKSSYAAIILALFSKKQYGNLVLGMARSGAKKSVEKRIRGLFMPGKSRQQVRITAALLAGLLVFACFTTACQPTPGQEPVAAKDAADLAKKIQASGTGSSEPATKEDYSHSFSYDQDKVTVDIKAEIKIPARLPVLRVKPYFIPMEQVRLMAQTLFEGNPAYEAGTGMTQAQITAAITALEKDLQQYVESENALQEHYHGNEAALQQARERYQWQIAAYQASYATAPESLTPKLSDWSFQPAAYYEDIIAWGDLTGQDAHSQSAKNRLYQTEMIMLSSSFSDRHALLEVRNLDSKDFIQHDMGFFSGRDLAEGSLLPSWSADDFTPIELAENEVVDLAQAALDRMGIKHMALARIKAYGPTEKIDQSALQDPQDVLALAAGGIEKQTQTDTANQVYGYSLHFLPVYEGLAVADLGFATPQADYGPAYSYETLHVNIYGVAGLDQPVIIGMQWFGPTELAEVENPQVQTLSFDQTLERFETQLAFTYTFDALLADVLEHPDYQEHIANIESVQIKISSVQLALVRIQIPNQAGVWRMVPAWIFQGTDQFISSGEGGAISSHRTRDDLYTYMVINAIDGSIIDPNLGY